MTKSKIIRRPNFAGGGITEAEELAFAAHKKEWISIAYRTEPADLGKLSIAIKGLYAAADLPPPRVILVPSPLAMAVAGGFSAAIWWLRQGVRAATYDATLATRAATYDATYDAIHATLATRNATRVAADTATAAAIHAATYAAIHAATYDATLAARAATYDAADTATHAATRNATDTATRNATDVATRNATDHATYAATDVATATYVATRNATNAATRDATRDATDVATYAATDVATDATYAATEVATDAATATDTATRNATNAATRNATRVAAADAHQQWIVDLAIEFGGLNNKDFFLMCASRWANMYQGGNMWAAWDCYLTGARDILGLRLPIHEKYAYWEQAAREGGFRIMHEKFCIISDFPEYIHIDEQNRPHCETGPSHRWRNGWELFHWHGVSVPAHWIRKGMTAPEVLAEKNLEVRRAGCEILGWDKILDEIGSVVLDRDPDPEIGVLLKADLPDAPNSHFLQVKCATGREFILAVPQNMRTALEANAWTYDIPVNLLQQKEHRT